VEALGGRLQLKRPH